MSRGRSTRRKARLEAVEILYAADVRGAGVGAILTERDEARGTAPYAAHLALGVERRRDEIDDLLRAKAVGWPPERMSAVDRNILRVGVLELMEGDVPPAVAIDEAIEVAKRFSGLESASFVNGVIEAVRGMLQPSGPGSGDD